MEIKTTKKARFGFVRAGLSMPSTTVNLDGAKTTHAEKTLYNEGGKAFVLLVRRNDEFKYKGLRFFYESDIPSKFRNEFKEFYGNGFTPVFQTSDAEKRIAFDIFKNFMKLIS